MGTATAHAIDTSRTILTERYRLEKFSSIDSTNAEAARMAAKGAPEGTVVWALEQTAGRGRTGNEWVSPSGNLFLSLVLRPNVPAAKAAQLSFLTANVMHRVLASILSEAIIQQYISSRDAELLLKWPNDILLNGKKLGGILLEAHTRANKLDWIVVGIGLNVESHPEDVAMPATSLHSLGIRDVSPKIILSRFLHIFAQDYDIWQEIGFDQVRNLWLHHAAHLGDPIVARVGDKEYTGTFENLDMEGAMVLREADGSERRITAGEVFGVTGH